MKCRITVVLNGANMGERVVDINQVGEELRHLFGIWGSNVVYEIRIESDE